MSLGTSNRDGGKTSESGHLRALGKIVSGDIITGLNAVQRAAGVNMSVDIQVGDAFVRRSDGSYAHPVFNDAVYNQVISAADGSNPRRDIVVIYVDYGQTPSTAVSNNTNGVVKIAVINGTPAGSPVDPTDPAIQSAVGAGNPWTKLCRVRVPAGQTSISNSLIDDLRSMTTANITNATITNAKLSTAAGELGGAWTTLSGTPSGFASFTDNTLIYKKIGTTVHFAFIVKGVSNSVSAWTIPLPYVAVQSTQHLVRAFDNGAYSADPSLAICAGGFLTLYKTLTGTGWTATGNKGVEFSVVTYETS